ncbi:Phosphatidylinositol 3,5-bisphosphate-binding protein [Friedmanniomyces endolithicus]|nr:Phosphatidylinositol 3,5-bisphosphate-binding protein [Friedmanniomyces endolithicus]KAK0793055.1 Phosphatidylinositol 3,5-bisphosphate-binding protein [Friedmanniomyces endolithicus]KAK0800849.1 Phosphatidylinositol 3,5-bisphosphate-binding protein [Friedmanniomyces endolithicus]KAK0808079.1 Phosphatidylinositol 3,5-bisphosphate-binding protein [Friedmanniomyces endolithicus]KAK0850016.1 Phosphatidylinositol 3,5-bisphosphate-binding protein [Friedmanniomyces endolithicus]
MNTRQSIQPSNQPAVLSLAFSSSRKRFIAGLADGFRCFRTDNCLATYHPTLPVDGGVAVAAALDDRYIAFVGGGRSPAGKPDVVIFWDAVLGKETARFHLHEPVLGVRLSGRWMVVVLRERTVVFEYQDLQPRKSPSSPADGTGSEKSDVDEVPRGPNKVKALYATSTNDHALACLRGDLLVLPAQSTGQVQLIPLSGGSKRVLRAHNSSLRCLAVSDDGTLLATASEQGTLIRVYSLSNLDQVAEFRRGSDHAIIFSLAFSPGNRWLACTSDKGTLHIFDLRPPHPAADVHTAKDRNTKDRHSLPHHRKTPSYAAHRLSAGGLALERESLSNFSGAGPSTHSSSPTSRAGSGGRIGPPTAYQGGSVQEYYGLRPPPASATPPSTSAATGVSALASAFKASGFAPRILRDVRSIASIPFHLGDEKLHWQGGAAFSWTTTPGGGRKRVRNAVLPLPGEGSGRPPKGVLGFAPREVGGSDEEGARVYVLGGGGEARWEVFEVLPAEGGGWGFVNRGFRRFLTRQFVE